MPEGEEEDHHHHLQYEHAQSTLLGMVTLHNPRLAELGRFMESLCR